MFVVLIRTLVLYTLLIVGIRLLGKRQLGELEPSELTLALIIADLASVPMQDNGIPLLTGVIPIAVLLATASLLSLLSSKFIRFRTFLCGRPSVVVRQGQVVEGALRANRLTLDELMEELRILGHPYLEEIHTAVLETNGQLSVLPYASQQPATATQVGQTPDEPRLPLVIISDGRLLSQDLRGRGYSDAWLAGELHARGLTSHRQVFLMTVDDLGHTYCIPKEGVS